MDDEKQYQWLCQVISAIGSSLELDKVLSLAAEVTAKGAGCRSCFLYLWDKQREKLVVRATTPGHEQYIRVLELKIGEGITGWTAKHLNPLLIEENAIKDERFLLLPDLDEESYQSFMTVPIVSPNSELIGVFTMYTVAPHKFPKKALEFVNRIATLVAGLIEKAMVYEQMKRKLTVLDGLADLSKALSQDDREEVILDHITKIIAEVLQTDSCSFMFLNREKTVLSLEQFPWTIAVSEQIRTWLDTDRPMSGLHRELLKPFQKLNVGNGGVWAAVTMQGTNSPLGLILCFRRQPQLFLPEDMALLQTISHQGALALEKARLVNFLTDRNQKQDFFDALFSDKARSKRYLLQQGRSLGVDLERPHLVAVIEVAQEMPRENVKALKNFCFLLEDQLSKIFAGSLHLSRNSMLKVILPVDDYAQIKHKLTAVKNEQEQKHRVALSIGLGNPCSSVDDYLRGLEEALEALKVGKSFFWDKKKVISFGELGIYRYLYKVWKNDGIVRDKQQELMEKLYDYDRQHSTKLLETLEKYLESLGQMNDAACELFVHRNTLRNRLVKISSLLEVDVTDRQNWFPLYIALEIVKLRALEQSGL